MQYHAGQYLATALLYRGGNHGQRSQQTADADSLLRLQVGQLLEQLRRLSLLPIAPPIRRVDPQPLGSEVEAAGADQCLIAIHTLSRIAAVLLLLWILTRAA